MDILAKIKEVRFWLDQVNTDSVKGIQSSFLNRAKNELAALIADGEEREYRKIFGRDKPDADIGSVNTYVTDQGTCAEPGYDGAHRKGNQY